MGCLPGPSSRPRRSIAITVPFVVIPVTETT